MSAPHATHIVEGYLARLEAELRGVDASRRAELVEDVRGHIAAARAGLEAETDADLLNIVDLLGDPAELAREARDHAEASEPQASRWGWVELAAIALTILAWPAGAILVALSQVWSVREKLLALGAIPFVIGFPLFGPIVGPVLGPLVGSLDGAAPLLMGSLGALPLVSAVYLAFRLRRLSSSLTRVA